MEFKEQALQQADYVVGCRRWFHAHPELGTKEYETTAYIKKELEAMGVEVQTFDDITGCIGTIKGAHLGRTVMLRADIDALPIQELNECSYVSQTPGVMHACGHDCHAAMLLGAAKMLVAAKEEIHGTVKLLFQMAEEIGTESRHYVEKGCLDDVDALMGMHVWAMVDSGTANFEDGPRMACSDRFIVKIKGQDAAWNEPHKGADALVGAAAAVVALQGIVNRINAPDNALVVTVGMMNGAAAEERLATEVELVGTVRTFAKDFRKQMPEIIKKVATDAAAAYGCTVESQYIFGPSPLINEHTELNEIARGAAVKVLGEGCLASLNKMTGAEDFSVLAEKVPAVYGYLGIRNAAKGIESTHHHPLFQVDEEQLQYGAGIYAQFALDYLDKHKA